MKWKTVRKLALRQGFLQWWFHPFQLLSSTFRFTTKLTLPGTLQLDLTALIKPATNARSCKIPDSSNPAPTLDLFKQKRCYGWWSTSSLKAGTLRDTVGTPCKTRWAWRGLPWIRPKKKRKGKQHWRNCESIDYHWSVSVWHEVDALVYSLVTKVQHLLEGGFI